MERLPLFHVVRFDSLPIHSAELQSAEIRFTYSQKFCERHTLVFESQAQNRVHVETASISLRRRSLRYRGAAFKEKYVRKTM